MLFQSSDNNVFLQFTERNGNTRLPRRMKPESLLANVGLQNLTRYHDDVFVWSSE